MKNSCDSCLMPFNKDPGVRENDQYCSLCFNNGELTYKGENLQEFQQLVYENMLNKGKNKYLAKLLTFAIKFAPRWKNK